MKKIYTYLSIILIPAIALLLAFTQGPSAGYTGSPLDGNDCSDCHAPSPATPINGWISTDIPPIGYTPGNTYTITLSTPGETTSKMGFQITAETAAAKAGMFVITNATRTQLTNDFTVTHTAAGTDPMGTPNSWTMDWTAPASGTGVVSFYAAVNAANANGANSGDQIFVTSLDVPESNIGIAENLESSVGSIFPNPADESCAISVPEGSQVRVYDNNGRMLISGQAENELLSLDLSELESGVYFVKISLNGQMATRKLMKR